MAAWKWIVVASVLLLPASCSSWDRAQRRPHLIRENLDYAAEHMKKTELEEAAQIYKVVLVADPLNEEAKAALAKIGDYDRSLVEPNAMGKNFVRRPKTKSIFTRIFMYPVNRVMDVLDIVSFHVGLEGGALVDLHATRGLQAAAGAGGGLEVGWWQKREAGLAAAHVMELAFLPLSAGGEGYTRLTTAGATTASYSTSGIARPTDPEYQNQRDYWGIGGRVIAGVVGAGVEVHPLEIADALAGFFIIDFLRDDIGTTRKLRVTSPETDAMDDLLQTVTPEELRERIGG